ncbi:succinoglycan biosynthesis protein [Kaistia algarum]|uniref:thermonuclease family protein n=1 Tax=Kaistia algarum TaxID=2083279 RepID=UPI000CE8A313|nr:thermonuclease family protein [Kaistia algarum]MCX5513381.1 thermonuclease family protein [Kaistia algarum]PPE81169.1 succinoglycan biosynthesis protein [Kaistia algarum]
MLISQRYRNTQSIAAVLSCLAALFGFATAAASTKVHVVDGDTLWIDGTTYRIAGIDAPEAGQKCAKAGGGTWPCGKAAVGAMQDLAGSGEVRCDSRGLDDYGRTLAVCFADGVDIGGSLVDKGLAWSFRKYSLDYAGAEDAAHAKRVGVWQAETEAPWDFRAHRWDVEQQVAPKGCPIKGNINRDDERIYHAPWSPWYTRTKIDEAHGERWFCTEGEALAAGWRAPRWGN